MHEVLVKLLLLATGVGGVVAAAVVSWRRRGLRNCLEQASQPAVPWWRGQPGPVRPGVGAGWLAFVLLNWLFAIYQPLLAASLFVRAYVLRAVFLRKDR